MNRRCQPGGRARDSASLSRGSGDHGGSKGGSKSGFKGGSKSGRKGGSKGGRKGGSKRRGRHRPNYQSRQPDAEWSGDEEMSMLQLKKAAACLSLNHSCISKF